MDVNETVVARLARSDGAQPDCFALSDRNGPLTIRHSRFYGDETGYKSKPASLDHNPSGSSEVTFQHCLFDGNSAATHLVHVSKAVTFERCLMHFPSFHMLRDLNLTDAQVTLSGNILDGGSQRVMRLDHASSALTAADNDQVVDSALDWTVGGGTNYADFAAVQTAGFEASGVVSDPSYSTDFSGAVEPIASWTASGSRGPDTSTWTDESIDAAAIVAEILAK